MNKKYDKIKNNMPLLYILIMVFLLMLVTSFGANSEISIDSAEIPIDGVIIWTGTDDDFSPWGYLINNTDWHLCNGNNGTTDLQSKFIVGFNPEDNDYDRIGETGGEETHTLTIAEMPYHEHSYIDSYNNVRYWVQQIMVGTVGADTRLTNLPGTTGGTGGSQAHENRPPYYTVAFIQRVS